MKKLFILLALLSVLFIAYNCSSTQTYHFTEAPVDIPSQFTDAFNATIGIGIYKKDVWKQIGTGVVIRSEKGKRFILITAAHVYKEEFKMGVVLNTTPKAPKDSDKGLQLIDRLYLLKKTENDLAIFSSCSIQEKKFSTVDIGEPAAIGHSITLISFPLGLQRFFQQSTIGSIIFTKLEDEAVKDTKFYATPPIAHPGSSGGGIYNDRGELIGIASWNLYTGSIFPSERAFSFFVHTDHIKKLVENLKVPQDIQCPKE